MGHQKCCIYFSKGHTVYEQSLCTYFSAEYLRGQSSQSTKGAKRVTWENDPTQKCYFCCDTAHEVSHDQDSVLIAFLHTESFSQPRSMFLTKSTMSRCTWGVQAAITWVNTVFQDSCISDNHETLMPNTILVATRFMNFPTLLSTIRCLNFPTLAPSTLFTSIPKLVRRCSVYRV